MMLQQEGDYQARGMVYSSSNPKLGGLGKRHASFDVLVPPPPPGVKGFNAAMIGSQGILPPAGGANEGLQMKSSRLPDSHSQINMISSDERQSSIAKQNNK